MGIEIIGKLTQKNNGDFKLVDLADVDYDGTGKSAKQELEKKIEEAKNSSTPYDDTAIKNDITGIKTDLGTEELTTTAKNVKGAVNEIAAQYKDIANKIENGIVSKIQSYPCGIIYLDGDTTGISKTNPVQLDILYVDEYGSTVFEGKSTTAWQGSGSLQYPNKNLSLKLKDVEGNKKKIKIFDYATSTYHLKCNYADYSMVRNSVGAQMVCDYSKI